MYFIKLFLEEKILLKKNLFTKIIQHRFRHYSKLH
jgi:hypothetical protein